MKQTLYFLALFLAFPTFGQNNFVPITDPVGIRTQDIFFTSPELGYSCDSGGLIRKITDYGATVEDIYTDEWSLRSIEFFNPDTGFAGRLLNWGSTLSCLLRTTDGGQTWDELSLSPAMSGICGMHALENGTIYACGAYYYPAYYYKSTDFGFTWTYFDMSDYALGMVDVYFTSDTRGFMGGQGPNGAILLKTEDAGESWETVFESEIPTDYIWKIHEMEGEPQLMYASLQSDAGPESLDYIWSDDGGDTWVARHATDYGFTQDLIFIDQDTAFISGHLGLPLHRSVDGGINWEIAGEQLNGNRFFIVDTANIYLTGRAIFKYGGISTGLNTDNPAKPTTTVRIFPNPVKKDFTVEATSLFLDHIIVSLLDAKGKYVSILDRSNLFPGKNEIKISIPEELPRGTYLLHLHTHSGVQMKRIVVE